MPKKKKVKKKAKIKLKKVILKKKTSSNDKKPASANPDEKPIITKIKKQASEKKVYNVKDFVVYPKHGVGKIVAVEKAKIGLESRDRSLVMILAMSYSSEEREVIEGKTSCFSP